MTNSGVALIFGLSSMLSALAAADDGIFPSPRRTDPVECLERETQRVSAPIGRFAVAMGLVDCLVPCFNKVSGATVGYSDVLTADSVGDAVMVARDTKYFAVGVFTRLEPETNANGDVIYHKYKIRDGFSQRADHCYDDDEPAPLSHEEQV